VVNGNLPLGHHKEIHLGEFEKMKKTFWIILAGLFAAISAPAAMANSQYTYSFAGACYFAGTNVSFTTNGPAQLGSPTLNDYTPNPGSTDEFAQGGNGYATCDSPASTDEGAITSIYFADSPFGFCGGPSPCTVQMFLVTGGDPTDGPTFAGLTVPDAPGTYDEFFGNGALKITVANTPEPASFALTLAGLGLLVLIAARRKRSAVGQALAN
jgi:PEP-CTERM motif-containing protein